jgi:hypothetical protein
LPSRRTTRSLGAAAGALLCTALLPTAVAFADTYEILPDPSSTEVITGFYGEPATPPAVAGSVQGYQLFDVYDKTTGQVVGTFDAQESTQPSLYGAAHELLLVTNDVSGAAGVGAGDTPPVGSVIDIGNYGNGVQDIYSALAQPDGKDVVTLSLLTPSASKTIPFFYDAAQTAAAHMTDQQPIVLTDGYELAPATGAAETVTSITGLAPTDVAIGGTQLFNVYDAATGGALGAFNGEVTNTSDVFLNYTEEILVTGDVSGTVGTAPGDTPPVGSLYNVFYLFGSDKFYNIYEVQPSADGNVVTDQLVTPFGDIKIPIGFYDATNLAPEQFTDPISGDSFIPVGSEQIAAIDGVPPLDSTYNGYQEFLLNDAAGNQLGTFDADVSTTNDIFGGPNNIFGGYSEAILVTSDSPAAGTAAGELPTVGSVFDINHLGFGFESIYSDIVSPTGGPNVITETLVTPFGDIPIHPAFDLAANAAGGSFFVPDGLGESLTQGAAESISHGVGESMTHLLGELMPNLAELMPNLF